MPQCPLILICDDDPVVHESLGMYLDAEGYEHISAYNGEEALAMVEDRHPDLMILDVMMPRMSGIDVCRTVRLTKKLPIIMLTAKSEEIDRILGLELGADDYIVKPFDTKELVARIKAVLRRYQTLDAPDKELSYPGLTINITQYTVTFLGKQIEMPPKELELLHFLASHPGTVFTREQLLEQVWGYDFFGDSRTVDVHIKRLRDKLTGCEELGWSIKTVWSVGYKFEVNKP